MAKRIRFERGQELQERARMVAAICIQPHVRKRITPRQLLPLPWDNKKSEMRNNAPQLTAEERKERFEKLVQKAKWDIIYWVCCLYRDPVRFVDIIFYKNLWHEAPLKFFPLITLCQPSFYFGLSKLFFSFLFFSLLLLYSSRVLIISSRAEENIWQAIPIASSITQNESMMSEYFNRVQFTNIIEYLKILWLQTAPYPLKSQKEPTAWKSWLSKRKPAQGHEGNCGYYHRIRTEGCKFYGVRNCIWLIIKITTHGFYRKMGKNFYFGKSFGYII